MIHTHYYRPTKAVVDLDAIQKNIQSLKRYLRKETAVIAVVKANGYGHGIVEVAQAALQAGAKMVSVATPDEAILLRENGVESDILVMAPTTVEFAEKAAELAISVTVADALWLQEVMQKTSGWKNRLKIHVKIDCGMGRVGVREPIVLENMIQLIKEVDQFQLEGAFTHFPCADDGHSKTTKKHFEQFGKMLALFPEKPKLVHASNSAATLLYPEYSLDAVRFGISLYGIAPSDEVRKELPFLLQPALSLESELSFVKKLAKGQTISYGATYTTEAEEWIGTLPIGYADGLKRGLRGQEVLIGGERMPIVGTICMDQCMVRLPRELPAGEKVVLIGKQGTEEILIEEWAEKMNTIPYEIVVSISERVQRVYASK